MEPMSMDGPFHLAVASGELVPLSWLRHHQGTRDLSLLGCCGVHVPKGFGPLRSRDTCGEPVCCVALDLFETAGFQRGGDSAGNVAMWRCCFGNCPKKSERERERERGTALRCLSLLSSDGKEEPMRERKRTKGVLKANKTRGPSVVRFSHPPLRSSRVVSNACCLLTPVKLRLISPLLSVDLPLSTASRLVSVPLARR
ncbi:hypothetical protein BHM03_00008384 [Ensete ventricosum]|nr:hypothetical protein BHM03_00008384 [Ensete ventricosum]